MPGHADHVPFVSSGSYPLRAGNVVRPLVDGEPAFRRICQAVEAAKKSVWVTVAFLERDVAMPDGRGTFFDVLDRAVARGLDVRAIFWRCPELEAVSPGVHFSGTETEREWLAERGSRFLARWDRAQELYCHHQKSWLIDAGTAAEIAFVGGINLERASVAPVGHAARDAGQVHDVYAELRGPAATDVHHNFVQRWNEASERANGAGHWLAEGSDLPFPRALSAAAGEVPVQIQRTVRAGQYRDGACAVDADRYAIERGERSILDQYLCAIERAQRSIYIEGQAIGSSEIVAALELAARRDVEIAFLVPGQPHRQMVARLARPESAPFCKQLDELASHTNFALLGIATARANGEPEDIYVHSKIALIDDAWCTIGSTNVADRSFYGDTELNATFWHAPTVRSLRCELFAEHTGVDTRDLDDRSALRLLRERAGANAARRARGEPQQGLAFALDLTCYARN
jgi:cardiolipin synthase A/B